MPTLSNGTLHTWQGNRPWSENGAYVLKVKVLCQSQRLRSLEPNITLYFIYNNSLSGNHLMDRVHSWQGHRPWSENGAYVLKVKVQCQSQRLRSQEPNFILFCEPFNGSRSFLAG